MIIAFYTASYPTSCPSSAGEMRGRRGQPLSQADVAHMNGKQLDTFYPPPLPDDSDRTESPPRRSPLTALSTNSSFQFTSASLQPPVSPALSLPPLSDELPLLEDGGSDGPPQCPDCLRPLTFQDDDGVQLVHCSHCLHARYMSTDCLFPPMATHSGLGPLLSRSSPVDESTEGGQLSRTVSNLFGTNGRANSFTPMGDSFAPPSATASLVSSLSFTAPTTLPLPSTSTYPPIAAYDDGSNFSSHSSFDGVSINPTSRSMSNAFSAFATHSSSASFTQWSAVPHASYLSDREGAAVRHIASVSCHAVPTMLQFDIDSRTGRPVARHYQPSGGGHSSNGYSDGELVMDVPRERLSVDRHSLAVVPLASTTPYHRLPDALTAPYMPVLPYTVAPSTRRYHMTATSPQSSHRHSSPASTSASSPAGSSAAAGVPSPDLTPAHYVAISELHIDELCNKLAMRGRPPSICRAALQHVMRQADCTYDAMQRLWQKTANHTDSHSAAHTSKAKTSHAVAMASAVFHYVYQRLVERHNAKLATTASANTSSAPPGPYSRVLVKLPQLEVARLSGLIATSADSSSQYRVTANHLSLYIDAVTPHLLPLDLDAMGGSASATTVLLSRPLHVEACRPSFIAYADKFKLDTDTLVLAIDILNAAVRLNLSSRRNHTSLSAAALFLACCLQAVKLTQHDYCQQIGLTEVTLRKVNKELGLHWKQLVPADYQPKAVPQFLLKQSASEQKKKRDTGKVAVKEDAALVEDDDGDTAKAEEVVVKKEPVDDTAAAVQPTATSGVQLLQHEPFDMSAALLSDATAVAPVVPPAVLTCSHRFSAHSVPRRSKAITRTRSLLSAAVTSDSDTEEEGEAGEQQVKEEGGDRSSSSSSSSGRHAAVDASGPPLLLPPHVPVFYHVHC